jgi:hypothetical protein
MIPSGKRTIIFISIPCSIKIQLKINRTLEFFQFSNFVSSDKLFDKMNNSLHFSLVICAFLIHLHFPELHFPLGHSELKEHLPSGALEHLPELHFAPLKPQSEAKEHLPPAASAHTPLLHFTFGLQSELKLHLP